MHHHSMDTQTAASERPATIVLVHCAWAGGWIWRDIVAGHRPRDLIGHLLARNSASAEAVRLYLLARLNESLIRPLQVAREILPVEQATGIVALDSGAEPPMLEIFDDMADLLLCDPIHDVDEDIGWPVKRTPV